MTETLRTDVVVVGSGPGGAGVAWDLAYAGAEVLIVEMGRDQPPTGRAFSGGLRYAGGALGALSLRRGLMITPEWLTVLRGVTTGGSSMLYLATAHDPDPELWRPFGFDLREEAEQRKLELGVAPLPDSLLGLGVQVVAAAARDLGYPWAKLNKFINAEHCVEECRLCVFGCRHGAKWHARDWVLDAVEQGATLMNHATCEQVLTEGDRAVGVRVRRGRRGTIDIRARKVVLAAGGIGSPQILRRSGVDEAGRSFFFDPFVMTTGRFDWPLGSGPMMATGMHLRDEGLMLSDMQYPLPVFALQALLAGRPLAVPQYLHSLPIMTKIRDDMNGSLEGSRRLEKRLSAADRDKLERGKAIAQRILEAAGAKSVWHSRPGAAHPGGTCAMGQIVDANLETRLAGCYVCDASVVPAPFGVPPTLTCLALSKRLSRQLLDELEG